MPRPRDRNPSLSKTCLICRQKIINPFKLHDNDNHHNNQVPSKNKQKKSDDLQQNIRNEEISSFSSSPSSSNLSHWKTLCLETLSMLFGLPAYHPLISIFTKNGNDSSTDETDTTTQGKMCNRCFQDISSVHLILWQLSSLEKKLSHLQTLLFSRLLKNYENLPTPTIFSPLGLADLQNNLSSLKYDDLVKILFEEIKSKKDLWPKPTTISPERWKAACQHSTQIASQQNSQPLQNHPSPPPSPSSPSPPSPEEKTETPTELILPDLIKVEVDPLPPPSSPPPPSKNKNSSLPSKRLSRKPAKFQDNPPPKKSSVIPSDDDDPSTDYHPPPPPPPKKSSRGRPPPKKSPPPSKKKTTTKFLGIGGSSPCRYLCTSAPSTCNLTFPTKKSLSSHIRSLHPPSTPSPSSSSSKICELCGITVPSKHLRKHFFLRHHGKGPHICTLCSMDFHSSTELTTHQSLHTLHQSTHPFTCVVCSKLFTNSMDLRTHVSSNHLSSGLKCDICGIMKPNEYLLQRHLKVHDRSKDFVCSQCAKRFSTKGYLKYHEDHYHTNLGRKFPCEICGKEFMHEKNVQRHLNSHKEEKAFKCGICGKGFNYSHLLKKHEEIHSGTKNYECEKCGKRFRQEQNLRQHYKSHREKLNKKGGGGGGGGKRRGKGGGDGVGDVVVEEISYEIREEEVMEGDGEEMEVRGEEEGEEMEVLLQVKEDFGGGMEATVVQSSGEGIGGIVVGGAHGQQFQSVQEIQFEAHPESSGGGNVMEIGGDGGGSGGGHQTATVVFLYEYQA